MLPTHRARESYGWCHPGWRRPDREQTCEVPMEHVSPMNAAQLRSSRVTNCSNRNLDDLLARRGGCSGRRCRCGARRLDDRLGDDSRRDGRGGQNGTRFHGCGIASVGCSGNRGTALWGDEREREWYTGRRLGLASLKAVLGRSAALSLTAANRWWRGPCWRQHHP